MRQLKRLCWAIDAFLDQIPRQLAILSSVVQEHNFRTHHFDFRLEKDGVADFPRNAFNFRNQIIEAYSGYVSSFISIAQSRLRDFVDRWFASGSLWPDPPI